MSFINQANRLFPNLTQLMRKFPQKLLFLSLLGFVAAAPPKEEIQQSNTESQDNVTILSSQEDPSSWLQASNQSVIGESHNVAENAKLNESILTSKEDPNSWLHFTNPTNFRQMGGSSSFRADHQREASSSDRRQSTSSFDSTVAYKSLDYDVIVIGSGIMGSAIAYKLAKNRSKTLLLEQYNRVNKNGSSHGFSRFIRYTHLEPMWLPLVHDSFKEWSDLQALNGNGKLIVENGLLTMDYNDEGATYKRAAILKRFGVKYEVLKGNKITKKFPHLQNYDDNWSGVYEPSGATLIAEKCVRAIQKQFLGQKHFAVLRDKEKVIEILDPETSEFGHRKTPFVRVVTEKGEYTARHVVVAAGGWLKQLLPDLPLKATPHICGSNFFHINSNQALWNPYPGYENLKPSPSLLITEADGTELYGMPGFDHKDAIKFNVHLGKSVDDIPPQEGRILENWMYEKPAEHIRKHWPDVSPEPFKKDSCIYTMTDDTNFLIDRHPTRPRILLAGGFSGTGFKYALTIGKIVQQMIARKKQIVLGDKLNCFVFNMKPFSLNRKIAENLKIAKYK